MWRRVDNFFFCGVGFATCHQKCKEKCKDDCINQGDDEIEPEELPTETAWMDIEKENILDYYKPGKRFSRAMSFFYKKKTHTHTIVQWNEFFFCCGCFVLFCFFFLLSLCFIFYCLRVFVFVCVCVLCDRHMLTFALIVNQR